MESQLQTIRNDVPVLIEYSKKQIEYINTALHDNPLLDKRWNIKSGATQCGKTSVDYMYVIPHRIKSRMGLKGALLITGVSLATIGRNVLEPMKEYWSSQNLPNYVSDVHKDATGNNYVLIRGQKVYLCGMLNKTAISRLRGAKFKYVYCDEIAEYNKDAFDLLKSRLSLPYSCVDGACNPESDTHWLYSFIHSDIDIYLQEYTIFDNPFLSKRYVKSLCDEYAGTVLYDRYILGLWKKAEGIIFKKYANDPTKYILDSLPSNSMLDHINIGVDFGGNGSKHTFVATGFSLGYKNVFILESDRIEGNTTPDELDVKFIEFCKMVFEKYKYKCVNKAINVYADSAEQVLIRGLRMSANKTSLPLNILNARKMKIKDRIELLLRLFGINRLYFLFNAKTSINAYQTCVYNSKQGHEDERLDDGTSDIDTCDATEYSIEPEYKTLLLKLS